MPLLCTDLHMQIEDNMPCDASWMRLLQAYFSHCRLFGSVLCEYAISGSKVTVYVRVASTQF